ncbi:CGP-CTERM sorting domain-containing protein [Thermococcus sp.]
MPDHHNTKFKDHFKTRGGKTCGPALSLGIALIPLLKRC